ncbi:unnamed protein product [Cladocopium goreaui]|uniref:Pentacotripeptide-repeat region of PRORP domain-containing protein n=1 Tax=Cladocopium goreaui TaxID=2562237 RepID=A0A9P1DG76_9DINO|nr:unnamed protein product [Cladocopium goreaui]
MFPGAMVIHRHVRYRFTPSGRSSQPAAHPTLRVAGAAATRWIGRPRLAMVVLGRQLKKRSRLRGHANQQESAAETCATSIASRQAVSVVQKLGDDWLMARIIKDYARAGELEWADALGQEWMSKTAEGSRDSSPFWVKTAVLLAKAWMRSDLSEKNLRKAETWLERAGHQPALEHLIQQARTSKRALKWLNASRKLSESHFDMKSVSQLEQFLSEVSQVDEAEGMMWAMMAARLRPPRMAFLSLISAHASRGRLSSAEIWAVQMSEARPSEHHLLAEAFARLQCPSEAEGWLSRMYLSRLAPEENTVVEVVNSYAKSLRPFAAEATLQRASQTRVELGIRSYAAVTEAFLVADKVDSAKAWLSKAFAVVKSSPWADALRVAAHEPTLNAPEAVMATRLSPDEVRLQQLLQRLGDR